MKVLVVSATPFEIQPLIAQLPRQGFINPRPYHYTRGALEVQVLISGVGLALTAYSLGRVLSGQAVDLAINAGIAGAFNRKLQIGDVVQVVAERFADLGVEEKDGSFTDIHTLGLIDPDQPPFDDGCLINKPAAGTDFLPPVQGISVNKVHGTEESIRAIRQRYPSADVESMEGAAFFYACLMEKVRFLEIRAISNYVEPRNRNNWDLPLAIGNLNRVLLELLNSLP